MVSIEKEPIPSAGLAVIDEEERILIVAKHHFKVETDDGSVHLTKGFPKGGVDNTDKNHRDAAIRETLEETGAHIGQLFIPRRKALVTYTNYKIDKNGELDLRQPKQIKLFGAYTTQKKFIPPDREKHPYASLVQLEKFGNHVKNPHDREAFEAIAEALLEMRKEVRKALKKNKMTMFV